MCKPRYFSIACEINPWMNSANQVGSQNVFHQWQGLVEAYKSLRANVELISSTPLVLDWFSQPTRV